MTIWQAFLLGLIQGITEFLPISSSGHLALGQYFLGLENLQNYLLFNLICHVGTLVAIFVIFFPLIKESLTVTKSYLWLVLIGTLPLFPLVFILKPIKSLLAQPYLLGPCFLFSALILFASLYWRFPFQAKNKWLDVLIIGIFQAVAILPGISRSGSTISAARLLGWQKESALQFSFLLAIPAILGATVLEGWQAWSAPTREFTSANFWVFFVGFLTSCVVGSFSLWILIRLVLQDKWSYFAWYCLIVGITTTFYFNIYA